MIPTIRKQLLTLAEFRADISSNPPLDWASITFKGHKLTFILNFDDCSAMREFTEALDANTLKIENYIIADANIVSVSDDATVTVSIMTVED